MASNLSNRMDGRTAEQFKEDVIGGQQKEDRLIDYLRIKHNDFFPILTDYEFTSVKRIGPDGIVTGDYRDEGDSEATFTTVNGTKIVTIEIKKLTLERPVFRFKLMEMERAIRNNKGWIYFGVHKNHLRYFTCDDLRRLKQNKPEEDEYVFFGGKSYVTINPIEYDDWVTTTTLEPFDQYQKHFLNMIEEKYRNQFDTVSNMYNEVT